MRPVPVVFLRRAFSLQPTVENASDDGCSCNTIPKPMRISQHTQLNHPQAHVDAVHVVYDAWWVLNARHVHQPDRQRPSRHGTSNAPNAAYCPVNPQLVLAPTYICGRELLGTRRLRMCSSECGITSARIDGTACASCSCAYQSFPFPCPSSPWLLMLIVCGCCVNDLGECVGRHKLCQRKLQLPGCRNAPPNHFIGS